MLNLKEKKHTHYLEYQELLKGSDFHSVTPENIEVLIAYSENNYIVFVDNEYEFDWVITDSFDGSDNKENKFQRTAILSKIEILQHAPVVYYFSKKQKITFARILGQAWVYALENNFDSSLCTIRNAEKYIKDRNREISRRWQLVGAYGITTIIYIITICESIALESYFLFSCLGALMSILLKKSDIDYDCQSGRFFNILEITGRFLTAFISANIALKLFDLNLIFSLFQASEDKEIIISLISFASGFSERLIPSYISKISTEEKKGDENL